VIAWLGTPDLTELSDQALDFNFEPPGIIDVPAFELVISAINVYESTAEEKTDSDQKVEAKRRVLRNFLWERLTTLKSFRNCVNLGTGVDCGSYRSSVWHAASRFSMVGKVCIGRHLVLQTKHWNLRYRINHTITYIQVDQGI